MYKKRQQENSYFILQFKNIYILIKPFKTIITVLIHSTCQDQLEIIILVL